MKYQNPVLFNVWLSSEINSQQLFRTKICLYILVFANMSDKNCVYSKGQLTKLLQITKPAINGYIIRKESQ